MKLGDIVSRVVVDARKLTDYVLNPDNPIGRHKALIFERSLGFTKDNYASLLQQIETCVLDAEAYLQRTDQHGQHYRVDLEIIGTEGQREIVRTGWLVAPGSDEARLVTLYALRRR
jgi:filamentous hemagglutinin